MNDGGSHAVTALLLTSARDREKRVSEEIVERPKHCAIPGNDLSKIEALVHRHESHRSVVVREKLTSFREEIGHTRWELKKSSSFLSK